MTGSAGPRFRQVLLYLLYAAGLTREELREKIQSEVTDQVLREDIMSTAQLLKMEGHQEGLQEGMQAGIQEGLRKGRQKEALLVARRLLAIGMTLEEIAPIVDFPLAELQALLARED
ncbi:conserved hypothetical protein (putative transposase or invertase) [Alkalispirochaeta americana]|uniref:Transposase, YhgA-like n=1 Tax=Alkalispirochaeta americana TaxID=159291 RepID=A0A1N6Q4D1_9SPIO|nr:hypothetical protein [Alkalispirochaeta americana]SIQ11441.1 conserved hypothetical protein (putative transposase or invertase) [Alkalispirochaeta americana]